MANYFHGIVENMGGSTFSTEQALKIVQLTSLATNERLEQELNRPMYAPEKKRKP
jgi:hypothetical protein